jgi:octanoyl-[GcvH]:protein N-octanoyltransferase
MDNNEMSMNIKRPTTNTEQLTMNTKLLPETMEILIAEADTPDENLELDTKIAMEVANGKRPATLRLWRDCEERGIVVSKKDVSGPHGQDAIEKVQKLGYHVYIRQTGGTAVPHARGVLNFSMMFPRSQKSGTTDDYYRLLCKPQIDWLLTYGIIAGTGEVEGSYCDGKYNVIVSGKKLVGTAQSWRGGLAGITSRHPGYILAHACIIVDVDLKWAMNLINQFYAWTDNPYRANPETSTTLKELVGKVSVPAAAPGQVPVPASASAPVFTTAQALGPVPIPESSAEAMQEFAMFLLPYYRGLGITCSLRSDY